ncbi:MAG: gamma-glutamylcyclotransferase [Alphaproteobacteria bacterium]|nr:gamma-glutamylcyclotransferase [Alphaproteobacteria bacterium]
MKQSGEVWVFAYGSLMWDPGFAYLEAAPALLRGYHRAFCIYSFVYRGTEARPGLVLGLDRGGACKGMAFRIAAAKGAGVLDYLDAREKVTDVYVRRAVPITVGGAAISAGGRPISAGGRPISAGGRKVTAHTYVADRGHHQYAGKQTLRQAVRLIAQGAGIGGSNRDYLESTVNHLDELGITDGPLHQLHAMVCGMAEGR